jgi:hypothetical protein
MMPLHLPEPELPTKRPLPRAADRPTDIRTATIPVGPMPPVTLPPPADHFFPAGSIASAAASIGRSSQFRGSSLPRRDSSAISATFTARLEPGLPWRCLCGLFIFEIT